MHVHDIDAVSVKLSKGNWKSVVTFEVLDSSDSAPVAGATVTGIFIQNGVVIGPRVCVTDGSGTCFVDSLAFPKKSGKNTSFTVTSVTHASLTDAPVSHDPDGDSDGTTIQISK